MTEPRDVLALAAQDSASYAAVVYPQFELPAHIGLLVEKLEAVERGKIRRLMLFLPPRHAKTRPLQSCFPPGIWAAIAIVPSSQPPTLRTSLTISGAMCGTS